MVSVKTGDDEPILLDTKEMLEKQHSANKSQHAANKKSACSE